MSEICTEKSVDKNLQRSATIFEQENNKELYQQVMNLKELGQLKKVGALFPPTDELGVMS